MENYWEDVTPEKAQEYLSRNASGRPITSSTVSMYARDMTAGCWHVTHQGIAFDEDGYLIDGQHRLSAVVLSGKTVRYLVTRGLSRDVFPSLDLVDPRTSADWFHSVGEKHASQLAAVARRAFFWKAGRPWSKRPSPSHAEIAKTYAEHPRLAEAASFARGWPARRTLAPALAGFCWWLFSDCDEGEAAYFMESLRTGENLQEGSPILALRERLAADRARGDRARYARGYQRQEISQLLAIDAWNHYRKRHKLTKLQLPSEVSDESFPRPI